VKAIRGSAGRAILHIGTPRTGTTSFQHILVRHRKSLEARGILYPELTPRSAAMPHLSHQHLGEVLDGRRPVSERGELLARLEALLAATSADTVVISYESLCQIPARLGAARRLAAVLTRQGFTPEILITVKPQAELANSSYTWRSQFLREQRGFADFLRAQFTSPWLRYEGLFAPWLAEAGGRARAVPLRDRRSPAPLVERIFAELELGDRVAGLLTPQDMTLMENRSPGPVAVEVSRRLRRQGAHLGLNGRVREATRFIEDAARGSGHDLTPFNGLHPALVRAMERHFAAGNDAFAQKVWGTGWAARMAETPPRPVNDLSAGGVDPAMEDVLQFIQHRTATQFDIAPRWPVELAMRGAVEVMAGALRRLRG
jgi:hypothetical protein